MTYNDIGIKKFSSRNCGKIQFTQYYKKMKKKLRLEDVATKAGVSKSSVARALGNYGSVSEGVRKRVLNAAKKMDYKPNQVARSLKTKRTNTIGVIISDITTYFFTSVVRGIADVASQNGYDLVLCNTDEDPEKENRFLRVLASRNVDGFIVSASGKNTYLRKLVRAGLPIILLDRRVEGLETTQVVVDNENGTYEAVTHLIRLGHRRIGIINGLANIQTTEERFNGYKKALQDNHIRLDPQLIKYGDFKIARAKEVTEELLDMKNPLSALFVSNEAMIVGSLLALRKRNVNIPDQIALVGFDDPVWGQLLHPPLTTVSQPAYPMGTMACQILLQKIDEPGRERTPFEELVLKPKLIVRGSCGKRISFPEN